MRDRGSAGILQVPTHWGDQSLRPQVTQGVTQTLHFLCPNTALFSVFHVSVGHRRVFPAVQLLGEGVGSVLECRAGWDFQWNEATGVEIVTVIENQGGKNFCLRDPDFTKCRAREELLE